MANLNVFGGTGFIGGNYLRMFPEGVSLVRRGEEDEVFYDGLDALYFISTTNNYHVFDNPTLDIETNLLKLMQILPRVEGTFNFISSWFVYGKNGDPVCYENSPCNPQGFYAITKYAAERLIQSYCETHKKDYRILRLCNVIGGDKGASKQKNAFEFLISKIKNNEDIEIYEGNNFRNYLHVEDCCRAIKLIIQNGAKNEIYNIGDYTSNSLPFLINIAMEESKSKSKIRRIPAPEFHRQVQVRDFFMDTEKLQNLGFARNHSPYTTIKQLIG